MRGPILAVALLAACGGDTEKIPYGMGTYGSRSLSVGGSAIVKAIDKIVDKGRKIAAHKLEADEADIEFRDGQFSVKGTDRTVSIQDIALTAYVPHDYPLDELEPGLEDNAFYDPSNFTYPFGTHVCIVEVDRDTGEIEIKRYVAIDDVGNVINPMIVEGQVHGGIAQGVGQAFLEGAVYDEMGQPVAGSYMDYTMPRADDLPMFEVDRTVTPCPHNPLGVKGAGEAGTIASTACAVNAVIDAVWHLGVRDIQMPLTPERVWRAIDAAEELEAGLAGHAHVGEEGVERALTESDVLVFSGGVSMGEYDLVRSVLDDMGFDAAFWKVRQRPGKPLTFGTIDDVPVFGLPGNPVSSAMCFEQHVRPAIATMLGRHTIRRERHPAVLESETPKVKELHHFTRGVTRHGDDGRLRVRDTGNQQSNLYSSVVRATCIIHLPEGVPAAPAGTDVEIEWLDW